MHWIFCEMLDGGPKPDRVTMLSIITSSAELGNFRFGMQCHAYVLRNGLESWDNIGNSLIDMYTKSGEQLAFRVFDQMSNKTVVSWNSLLAGFARNGDVESAQGLFNEMPERDIVSWNTMIGALVQQSFFRDAIELFHSMQSEGWTRSRWCGDPQSAIKVFSTMKERDVSAWTAAIGAMAMEGNGERAHELFHGMLDQGVVPDEVVFSGVLTACSHAGLVKQGMQIFNGMKEHGITPHIIHYGCVVDLLGRAGLLDEALDFINTMPMEPNGAIWGAFLAACRIHKNEKMATCAAELITKSAEDKPGVHVLLSNIYASAAKWDDVAKLRMQMKEKGMRKTPGSSSVEEINCRLKHAGYVPDLTNVLLDIDEQEKEFLLNRHSEKLAIAFGLVSSSQGVPIRVLRICGCAQIAIHLQKWCQECTTGR
ncbi:Pentatricopeptide repeat-containing protein [Sesamum angolense]|uniref:Pentatricopeptide repeat-containing protein n=1 Tax=Sesamum angolense TaxID=2727404 RepID=A0AAE2C1M8_9LAMI|nr:Pentatricopeptide repeat-containing protein [Sesamum angolense]